MKQFAICLGVVVILLLNVMELFRVVGVLCWIDNVFALLLLLSTHSHGPC